jgi:hypothetical protein
LSKSHLGIPRKVKSGPYILPMLVIYVLYLSYFTDGS